MISDLEKMKLEAFKITEAERILQYDFIEEPSLPAPMGLSADYEIVYNKKIMDMMSEESKKFVLIHEFLHDILDHHPRMHNLLGDYVSENDVYIFNLAADHIVNTIISKLAFNLNLSLPEDLTKSWVKFNGIGDDITVEGLYRKLKENAKVTVISYGSSNNQQDSSSGDSSQSQSGNGDNKNKNDEKEDSHQSQSSQSQSGNQSEMQSGDNGKSSGSGNSSESDIVEVTLTVEYDGQTFSKKKIVVNKSSNNGKNNKSGKKISPKYGMGSSKAEWMDKFASKVGSNIFKNEVEFTKVPLNLRKSFMDLLTIIKSGADDISFKKRSKLNDIIGSRVLLPSFVSRSVNAGIAIDVSGSITEEEYSTFISIIKSHIQMFTPDSEIVSFDTSIIKSIKIREVYNSTDKLKMREGYGGTDFNEVFEKFKNKDLVVVFTDLFPWSWPSKKPHGKLFFIAKLVEKVEVPYGKVIYF